MLLVAVARMRWRGSHLPPPTTRSGGGGHSSPRRWRGSGGGPSSLLQFGKRGGVAVPGSHGVGVLASEPRYGLAGGLYFFIFFTPFNRGVEANRLGKGHINRDLSSEVVAKTALEKAFCPPLLKVFVVV